MFKSLNYLFPKFWGSERCLKCKARSQFGNFRNRVILEAEAESESIRVRGEAEAFAIEAKAKAEAEQMAKKADAWKDYQDAAMVDMILETLPKVLGLNLYTATILKKKTSDNVVVETILSDTNFLKLLLPHNHPSNTIVKYIYDWLTIVLKQNWKLKTKNVCIFNQSLGILTTKLLLGTSFGTLNYVWIQSCPEENRSSKTYFLCNKI